MRSRRRLLAAATLVVAAAALLSPSAAAAADCDGVWVVVDASATGGGVTTRCATGNPRSGLDALTGAGHGYAFVPTVPGMVCTIDGRPDPCNGAPTDAYWSYWYAEAGGSWTYNQRGAAAREPKPGTVEGWAFGAGAPPSVPPPAPPKPEPRPEPESDPQPRPAPRTDSTGSSGSRPADDTGDGAPRSDRGPEPEPPVGEPPQAAAPDASIDDEDDVPAAAPPEDTDEDTVAKVTRDRLTVGDPRLPAPAPSRSPGPPPGPDLEPTLADVEVAGAAGDDTAAPLAPVLCVLLIAAVTGGAVWRRRRRMPAVEEG